MSSTSDSDPETRESHMSISASDSSIAGPSQQNPDVDTSDEPSRVFESISSAFPVNPNVSDVPESSAQNLEQNPPGESFRSFSFQVRPARILKRAIHSLRDAVAGLAYISIDEKGVLITVDTKEGFVGFLSLLVSGLINFKCRKPSTEPQTVYLPAIYWALAPVDDDNTVTVYHVDGSNQLSFKFGAERSVERLEEMSGYESTDSSESIDPDENIRSFSFQLKPAGILKRVIHVQCDSRVNELGLAYIHVDEKGFQITVDTMGGTTTSLLSLCASGLINFECRKPSTEAQAVLLTTIYCRLAPIDDEDTITVYQVDGSKELSFMCERPGAVIRLCFNLSSCRYNIGKLPEIKPYTEGTLPSHDFSRVFREISMADEQRRQVVAVEIEKGKLKLDYMDELEWYINYRKFKHRGTEGKELGQNYRAWFHCNFATALDKACDLVDQHDDVRVCFSLLPTKVVVFQFNLGELGNQLILRRALEMDPE